MGQTRKWLLIPVMSAFPLEADPSPRPGDVGFVPHADMPRRANGRGPRTSIGRRVRSRARAATGAGTLASTELTKY
jgi:hypothetical protein